MSLKSNILKQLKERENDYVSGQSLAETFGVTRAAVWKAVASLKKEGHVVEGTPKAGYRLHPSDVLEETELKSRLEKAGLPGINIYVVSTLPSTNTFAEKLLNEGVNAPCLIAAKEQTAGQARRNGRFASENGGLYMSILFFPKRPPETLSRFTNEIYGSVNSVLQGEQRENEIFSNGKKICGILTQCVTDPDEIKSCIAGIGIYTERLSSETRKLYPTKNILCAAIARQILSEYSL